MPELVLEDGRNISVTDSVVDAEVDPGAASDVVNCWTAQHKSESCVSCIGHMFMLCQVLSSLLPLNTDNGTYDSKAVQ